MPSRPLTSATRRTAFACLALLATLHLIASGQATPKRRLAITIDDLPFLATDLTPEAIDRGTTALLSTWLVTRRRPSAS